MLEVEIADRQSILSPSTDRLRLAVEQVLAAAGYECGSVSVAIVDDAEMHRLNRQYLEHDYPTDVLSFVLEDDEDSLEGQLVVSAETAQRQAAQYGWGAADELLLYTIHGALHLVGHDDHTEEDRREMRAAEREHLARFGLEPPPTDNATEATHPAGHSRESDP